MKTYLNKLGLNWGLIVQKSFQTGTGIYLNLDWLTKLEKVVSEYSFITNYQPPGIIQPN